MQHNLNLKINDRLDVWTGEESYRSLIMDLSEEEIKINVPVNDGRYLVLERGESVELNYYSRAKNCYKFLCKVISRGIEGNIGFYTLGKPYGVEKIQRRENFRVDFINKLFYKSMNEEILENEIVYNEGIVLDLSAGGIRAALGRNINKGDGLFLKLNIKGEELEVQGVVVRCEDTLDGKKHCGIQFTNITERQSDKIISELFEITRKQITV